MIFSMKVKKEENKVPNFSECIENLAHIFLYLDLNN